MWPPDFQLAIATRLAGYLATGLLDRAAQGEGLDNKAEGLLRRAMRRDRGTYQGPDVSPDPALIAAWKGTRGAATNQALASISSGTST